PVGHHLHTAAGAHYRGHHLIVRWYCRTLPARHPGSGNHCSRHGYPPEGYPHGRAHLAALDHANAPALTALVTGLPRTPCTTTCTAPAAQALKRASMEKPWYFIQLSDTHIVADTRQESHGVNTYATLSRAIAQVNHLDPAPAFAIFTGDLINDDDPQSYRVLK